jgi:TIR domain
MAKKRQKPVAGAKERRARPPSSRPRKPNNGVFISWSGNVSRMVAEALKSWLPDVIEEIVPWISTQDISAGLRWGSQIDRQLQQSDFGIVCLTPDNLQAPWILFEAGALAKAVDISRGVPYLFRVSKSDVEPPLGQFNAVTADREGTYNLLRSINTQFGKKYDDAKLEKKFDHYWSDLETALVAIPEDTEDGFRRADRELIEELLELARRAAHPNGEFGNMSNQIILHAILAKNPAPFDSGFDLVDHFGLVPIYEAKKMGDGTLYAYWRSLRESIGANEDSDDVDVIHEQPHYRDVEKDVYQEIQNRMIANLDRKGRRYW